MMKIILLGLSAWLVACVSVPMAKNVDDIEAKRFETTPGMANVYIFRDGRFGSAVKTPIVLDGSRVANMTPETFAKVTLPPGTFVFESHSGNRHKLALNLKANQNYFVQQTVRKGQKIATVHLKTVPYQVGQGAILNCKLVKTSIL